MQTIIPRSTFHPLLSTLFITHNPHLLHMSSSPIDHNQSPYPNHGPLSSKRKKTLKTHPFALHLLLSMDHSPSLLVSFPFIPSTSTNLPMPSRHAQVLHLQPPFKLQPPPSPSLQVPQHLHQHVSLCFQRRPWPATLWQIQQLVCHSSVLG